MLFTEAVLSRALALRKLEIVRTDVHDIDLYRMKSTMMPSKICPLSMQDSVIRLTSYHL